MFRSVTPRACITLTQGLEGLPMLGKLLRDTLLGGMMDFVGCWPGASVFSIQ